MTPSPDIIRDFSRLQADCRALGESNICFAQENARLRELGEKLCLELEQLAWLSEHILPNEAEKAVAAWREYISSNAVIADSPERSGGIFGG